MIYIFIEYYFVLQLFLVLLYECNNDSIYLHIYSCNFTYVSTFINGIIIKVCLMYFTSLAIFSFQTQVSLIKFKIGATFPNKNFAAKHKKILESCHVCLILLKHVIS